jgi:F0F1-type ATP synthase epsilon subunit
MSNQKETQVPKNLIVKARTPLKVIYEGECMAITAQNTIGPFDVLPGHGNYITNISGPIIIHELNRKDKIEYPVQMGIIRVHQNTVYLYIILTGEE